MSFLNKLKQELALKEKDPAYMALLARQEKEGFAVDELALEIMMYEITHLKPIRSQINYIEYEAPMLKEQMRQRLDQEAEEG